MKKIFIISALIIQALCLVSCYKELGNYTYHAINELTITSIDTVNGYNAAFGDTLSISPVLTNSQTAGSSHTYSYQWSLYDQFKGDQVLSTNKDLKIRIAQLPGSYTLQYRVTDLTTGVLFHTHTTLLVRTDVYQGYMVLNEVDGNSRLDMLSYDQTSNKFTQYTDVLKKMGSSLPPQGQPYKVLCTRVRTAFNYSDSTYGIYLVTASGTNRIHPETFDWNPTYDIRYEVGGNIAPDFKADNMIADPGSYYICIFMVSDNNVYTRNGSVPQYILPLNKYVGSPLFKVSPYVVSDAGQYTMFYNMDSHSFAMTTDLRATTMTDPPKADQTKGEIDYPTGGDLLFMDKTTVGYGYAVTKEPGGPDTLTKFLPGSVPVYKQQIQGTDIDKATHFAVCANPEYLFYSVGGKVYEYDLYSRSSKLMLDKGPSEITYLAFDRFSHTSSYPNTYGQWARWLTVGSYDPAGTAGANGTLEQYSVKDANDPLVFQRSWTGFGKIVSISYRER